MSTTTTTTAKTSPSLSIEQGNTVHGTFNYWGTTDLPEVREIKDVFSGKSSKLRSASTTVHDIRPRGLDSFNLTKHGFQVLKHSSSLLPPRSASIPDLHDEHLTTSTYWPELVSLLKSQLGVRSAVAINTTVRDESAREVVFNNNNPRQDPGRSFFPFFVVHGDYTPPGGRGHMRAMLPSFFEDNGCAETISENDRRDFFHLKDEIIAAEEEGMRQEGASDQWEWSGKNYQGPRWAMLSVWRPLKTVRRDPLAVMDPRSLFREDGSRPYAPFERMYKDRPGFEKEYRSENMLPIAPEQGDGYTWYYISEQKPEEVYALKLFDSEAHNQGSQAAECVAHSAFSLPNQENEEMRRSAEVRMIVIW